jgi:hypothetical protein
MEDPCSSVDDFLSKHPIWLRKLLTLSYDFSQEETREMNACEDWPARWEVARDAYEQLIQACPERFKKYRNTLRREHGAWAAAHLPSLPRGARRKNERDCEIRELRKAGHTQKEIALLLNIRYPALQDANGNPKPITSEVVRKALSPERTKRDRK